MVCLFGTAYFCNRLVLCLYGYKSINGGVGMKVQKCKHQVNNGWCKDGEENIDPHHQQAMVRHDCDWRKD